MSSPVSDRSGRGPSGPHSVLRKEDLPGVGVSDPEEGGRRRDPSRQTGPRRRADPQASGADRQQDDASDAPQISDEGLPAVRPRALSIPYATLPPNKMPSKAPGKGPSIPPADFSDESGISSAYRPSAIPPAAPLPRGVSRTPSSPARSYRRAICRDHGLALSNEGTCLRCVQDRAARRSQTITRILMTLIVLAVIAGSAIALTLGQ